MVVAFASEAEVFAVVCPSWKESLGRPRTATSKSMAVSPGHKERHQSRRWFEDQCELVDEVVRSVVVFS